MAKYIIFQRRGGRELLPVIFPEGENHDDMASVIQNDTGALRPLSAGFVKIQDGALKAYGTSPSLKLASRGEDSLILSDLLG